ncbi:MAG: hypothetical protein ABJH93_10680, partial [Roseibium sp.]
MSAPTKSSKAEAPIELPSLAEVFATDGALDDALERIAGGSRQSPASLACFARGKAKEKLLATLSAAERDGQGARALVGPLL